MYGYMSIYIQYKDDNDAGSTAEIILLLQLDVFIHVAGGLFDVFIHGICIL